MKKVDLVIGGHGEVGQAIMKCYATTKQEVLAYDLTSDKSRLIGNEGNVRCMHVCIPCKDKIKFIKTVLNYMERVYPDMVIIHSTVPMGTTREIYTAWKESPFPTTGFIIAHSPIIGKHPDLFDSIKHKFTKPISCIPFSNRAVGKILEVIYNLFDNYTFTRKPENTEVAKIFSTTEYGWHIAIVTEIERYCKENNLDFDFVYTEWRNNYNSGYKSMELDKFIRPVLTPCSKGRINGHCIVENLQKLLRKYMPKTWLTNIKPKRLIKIK